MLKGGCIGSSESTLVKMSHRWKSHVTAQIRSCHMRASDDQHDHCRILMLAIY